jgi:hypothetical protein
MDVVDSRDQFESASYKWWKIANLVNACEHLSLPKNNDACKDKWGTIYGDFKLILTAWLQ